MNDAGATMWCPYKTTTTMETKNENPKGNVMAQYIRFDWAMKRLLRDKANFAVLDGFLTTLFGRPIKIRKLLESESNQESPTDKQNRVDLLAEEADGQLILVEVQNTVDYSFFHRMLYGAAKLVTEYIKRGDKYNKIRKVYSINIVYCALGDGDDYVYHSKAEFRGLHTNSLLNLQSYQKKVYSVETIADIYPEFYIIRVNEFDKLAKTPLDEWIKFLKSGEIDDDVAAPGLSEAKRACQIAALAPAERERYWRHVEDIIAVNDSIEQSRAEGMEEGIKQGIEQGIEQGIKLGREAMLTEMAQRMIAQGISAEVVKGVLSVRTEDRG